MTLSRHTSRIYLDEFDIWGTLNAIQQKAYEEEEIINAPYYLGSFITLWLILNQEEIRDQSVFIQLFDNKLDELKDTISEEKESDTCEK